MGLVIPVEWDDNGKIKAIAIATYDEERVIIVPNTKAKELMLFLRKAVQVNGVLRQKGNTREIEIHEFAMDHYLH